MKVSLWKPNQKQMFSLQYIPLLSFLKRAQKPANPFILFPPHAFITEVSLLSSSPGLM